MRQTQFFDQRNNTQASWLFFKDGLVGCVLCKAAGKKNIFGRCLAEPKLGNIIRHAEKTADHAAALQQWNDATQHVVPEAHAGGGPAQTESNSALSFAHALFQRTLVQVGGSFKDFQRWLLTARLATGAGFLSMIGARVSKQLTTCFADKELEVTKSCSRHALWLG